MPDLYSYVPRSVEHIGIPVRATDNTTCSLAHGAEVVVSLRPHTHVQLSCWSTS